MSFGRFLKDSARYRHFIGDGAALEHRAEYEEYYLDGVAVREVDAWNGEGNKVGVTALYFFPSLSRCRDELGDDVPLPGCGRGDICVIGERRLKVTGAEYLSGEGGIGHIRITLI